ncbi:DnaJ domain-containing protein [Pararhizobium sp. YC-54]|uniref:DnaJ C-terminal domain-containing protein n=1 Tax=Pararhizobium sp. YC-54 TaxID=2986920 RepID=UPI0021F74854|nr:DnaJ C-terminal domain-containing protein [Pararhizobium sp. YC-54]MCW0000409.1 DnaJ domain-containing protein [Pararhizobium sp. YC-54]
MRDPYSVLGVRRNAGPDEIKAAWRSVAKAVHPDQNKDDPLATQRFAEAGRAYEVLKDPKLRNRYDYARREAELRRMEEMKRKARGTEEETIDPETAEDMIARIFGTDDRAKAKNARPQERKPAAPPREKAEPKPEQKPEPKAETAVEPEGSPEAKPDPADKTPVFGGFPRAAAPAADLVSAIVRRIRGAAGKSAPEKVPDIFCDVTVSIEDIFRREKATATLPDGQTLKVALPAGTTDGSIVRLKEMGYRLNGMLRGDVVVAVRVDQDGRFRTDGTDLRTTLPVNIQDAVLGCETTVETLTGPVSVTVPAWSGSDHVIRVAGHGLPTAEGKRGDLLVELRLMLWEKPDEKVTDLMRSLRNGLFL